MTRQRRRASFASPAAGRAAAERGFTVLEAILALAIASLVLTALYRAEAEAFHAARRIELQQAALPRARTQLDRLAGDGWIAAGTFHGAYDNGLRWRLVVSPLVEAGDEPALARPYWVTLTTYDPWGRVVIRLDTAKLARQVPP